jgi:hypothetical protein
MTRPGTDDWREQCRHCIAKLAHILEGRPEHLHAELTEAVRAVVALRGTLLAQRPNGGREQERLNCVNSVVSVLVGAEFPLVGVRWQRVEMARDALCRLESGEALPG